MPTLSRHKPHHYAKLARQNDALTRIASPVRFPCPDRVRPRWTRGPGFRRTVPPQSRPGHADYHVSSDLAMWVQSWGELLAIGTNSRDKINYLDSSPRPFPALMRRMPRLH
jgi:hypothetical protein